MKTKVSILSAAVAVALSANAFAEIQPLSGDQFTVGGEATIGGKYVDSADKKDGFQSSATEFSLKVKYKNGGIVGYVEQDFKAKYGRNTDDDVKTDLDKAWVGYDFGFGVLSYGIENDTALDKVDGAGDLTFENGFGAPGIGDAFDVVKLQGSVNGIAYGLSSYNQDDTKDAAKGYNGYLGFEADMFSVYAGYEKQEASEDKKVDEKIYSLTGSADFGVVQVGANIWKGEVYNENGKNSLEDTKGFYVSVAKSIDALELAAGYGKSDFDVDVNEKSFNVSAKYNLSSNTYVGADVVRVDVDDEDKATNFYVKAGYVF